MRHNWWGISGEDSDPADESLAETAIREVSEESSNQIYYSRAELVRAPFHDLVTRKKSGQFHVFRMFIAKHANIDINKINDSEHTDHYLISISVLLNSLINNKAKVIEEGQQTARLFSSGKRIILHPPLYEMLQQKPVLQNLTRDLKRLRLLLTRTQGAESQLLSSGAKYVVKQQFTSNKFSRQIVIDQA